MTLQLRTEVRIDASPEAVWEVLTDFPKYREWNPFIPRIDGRLDVGAKLEVEVSQPGGSDLVFKSTIAALEEPFELRWASRLFFRPLLAGEHFFLLKRADGRTTQVTHGENFSGLIVRVQGVQLARAMTGGFAAMNQALKKRVESSQ